jgi:hypothetical protein
MDTLNTPSDTSINTPSDTSINTPSDTSINTLDTHSIDKQREMLMNELNEIQEKTISFLGQFESFSVLARTDHPEKIIKEFDITMKRNASIEKILCKLPIYPSPSPSPSLSSSPPPSPSLSSSPTWRKKRYVRSDSTSDLINHWFG